MPPLQTVDSDVDKMKDGEGLNRRYDRKRVFDVERRCQQAVATMMDDRT